MTPAAKMRDDKPLKNRQSASETASHETRQIGLMIYFSN